MADATPRPFTRSRSSSRARRSSVLGTLVIAGAMATWLAASGPPVVTRATPDVARTTNSQASVPGRWFKGNLHTHTLNSDGDSTPEEVVRWYREHGYDFLVLTDHNFLTAVDGLNAVQGAPGKFLVVRGEEVTTVSARRTACRASTIPTSVGRSRLTNWPRCSVRGCSRCTTDTHR
jgi:hypothetical protein